jgi:preprotein translocase subunit SecA
MAGRGVDIILGGNPSTKEEAEEVKSLGGLHVIGTERHESRRIDNQLRGRSGRQGDPGSTQFYVSMEDDLMRIFGGDRIKNLMAGMKIPEDMPIANKFVSRAIERSQERVEGNNFDVRKHLLSYDDVLSKHREVIYQNRQAVLEAFDSEADDSLKEIVLGHFDEALEEVVMFHIGEDAGVPDKFKSAGATSLAPDKNKMEIVETLSAMVRLNEDEKKELTNLVSSSGTKMDVAEHRTKILERLMEIVRTEYGEVEKKFGSRKELKELEKAVILRMIDRLWIDHLDIMTALRQSVGLRGYGQRDPLIEYRRESFGLFNKLLESIAMDVASNFFKYAHRVVQARQLEELAKSVYEKKGMVFNSANSSPASSSATVSGAGKAKEKIGRNDQCPCGSGKKYKRCCGGIGVANKLSD